MARARVATLPPAPITSSGRIEWARTIPDDVRALFAPYVRAVEPFLPSEYHTLFIAFEPDKPDAVAEMTCKRAYRECTLTVCGGWLTKPEPLRRKILVHEIIHTILEPIDRVTVRAIEALGASADDGPWADVHIDAAEIVTEDLARHILKLIPESAWRADG